MLVDSITDLIGNTPLLRIPQNVHGLVNIDLFAKLEFCNPFGSVKDRIAWEMIKADLEEIKAKGQTILENSSGNTAKALQAIAATHGIPFKLVSALAKVRETKDVLRLLGAEIEELSAASDCFDPNDPNDPQFLIEKAAKESQGKIFFSSQFTNRKNPEAHFQSTGVEIARDLGSVDYFFAGLGTTGTSLGAGQYLRKINPNLACIGIVASKNDYIPGIRSMDQMWESGLFKKEHYHEFIQVSSQEAIDAELELIRRCGVLCGPSSGANYKGTLRYLRSIDAKLTSRKTAVFIVCDRVEWYVSYLKERRPELFGEKSQPDSIFNLSEDEVFAAPQVQAKELQTWIEEKKALVVDIRSNLTFSLAHISGSQNIPLDLLEKLVNNAHPFPPEMKIVFVCQVGVYSRRFAAYLLNQGYDAYSLEGGLQAWRQQFAVASL